MKRRHPASQSFSTLHMNVVSWHFFVCSRSRLVSLPLHIFDFTFGVNGFVLRDGIGTQTLKAFTCFEFAFCAALYLLHSFFLLLHWNVNSTCLLLSLELHLNPVMLLASVTSPAVCQRV